MHSRSVRHGALQPERCRAGAGCHGPSARSAAHHPASAHTGGLGKPVVQPLAAYGDAALDHYRKLGVELTVSIPAYLASEAEQQLVHKAFSYWPGALKVVDPVLADHGRFYTGMQDLLPGMRELCHQADLILPNLTEACFLLGRDYCADELTADQAQAVADEVSTNVQRAVGDRPAAGKASGLRRLQRAGPLCGQAPAH